MRACLILTMATTVAVLGCERTVHIVGMQATDAASEPDAATPTSPTTARDASPPQPPAPPAPPAPQAPTAPAQPPDHRHRTRDAGSLSAVDRTHRDR